MTAPALISGKLHGEPVTRPTRNGGQVTFFKLRVVNGAELELWDCATFGGTARAEIEGFGEGAASPLSARFTSKFSSTGASNVSSEA